jgi:hypothetical protein
MRGASSFCVGMWGGLSYSVNRLSVHVEDLAGHVSSDRPCVCVPGQGVEVLHVLLAHHHTAVHTLPTALWANTDRGTWQDTRHSRQKVKKLSDGKITRTQA